MINRTIAHILPYMPEKMVWLFSKRYIAGATVNDGIKVSQALNQQGFWTTVDLLGEFIQTLQQAKQNKESYLQIIDSFSQAGVPSHFSLKPTSFGLLINPDICFDFISEVVAKAATINSFVRIDMEDSHCTSLEIELFRKLHALYPAHVGLVLQAYLHRSVADLELLIKSCHNEQNPLNIRLCKGIYIESPSKAIKNFKLIQKNYLQILKLIFKNGVYAAIATHDQYLIDEALNLIKQQNLPASQYEFQMLYGVTPNRRDALLNNGHHVRLYVPFGSEWFGYCSRRIKENPKIAGDILKALVYRK